MSAEAEASASAIVGDTGVWRTSLVIGSLLDAVDASGRWRPAIVRNVRDRGLHVALLHDSDEEDTTVTEPEWIGRDSDRLSEKGTRASWSTAHHLPQPIVTLPTAAASSSSSSSSAPAADWRTTLQVGDVLDALDTSNSWYTSTVRQVRPDAVEVHYHGWGDRWDEWIPRDSDRLARRGTRCVDRPDTSTASFEPAAAPLLTPAQLVAQRWKQWGDTYSSVGAFGASSMPASSSSASVVSASASSVTTARSVSRVDPTTSSSGYTHLGGGDDKDDDDDAPVKRQSGCAIRRTVPMGSAASSYSSASFIPAAPAATSELTRGEFISRQRQLMASRNAYAKLTHMIDRAHASNEERVELAFKILTGAGSDDASAIPSPLPSPTSGRPTEAPILPLLSFYSHDRVTLLMRLLQLYHQIDDRDLRASFCAHLPAIGRAIDEYDVHHTDLDGRTTLHWCVTGSCTPRPGGFLFEVMRLLLAAGASPSAVSTRGGGGDSVLECALECAGANFDLVVPVLRLLRSYGADVSATDRDGNTILHRLVLNGRSSSGLLEECTLDALQGYDLFAANRHGRTALDLIAEQVALRPTDADLQLAAAIVEQFTEAWLFDLEPFLRAEVEVHLPPPLAAIAMEYVDGRARLLSVDDATSSSPASSSSSSKAWTDFAAGDLVDCFDTAQKWYLSTVLDVRPDAVLIHFNGWPPNWDEWIARTSPRLARRGAHAAEYGHIPGAMAMLAAQQAEGRAEI